MEIPGQNPRMARKISFANVDLTTRSLIDLRNPDATRNICEELDDCSRFLEPEHKVELEFSDKTGGLVISPSTAARLYDLADGTHDDDTLDSDVKNGKNVNKTGWRKYGGILFSLGASFFFSLSVVMVKILEDYHPLCISVYRYLGVFVPSIPIMLFYHFRPTQGVNVFQTVSPLSDKEKCVNLLGLMCRGLLGCTSVLLRFYSLKYLSIADSSVISYSSPVFVIILAHFCLGEKCGVVPVLIAFLTSVGVFIIVRPPLLTGATSFDHETLIGTSLALLSMACNSTVLILMRKIRNVHYALMLLTFGTWGVMESLVVALSAGVLELPRGESDSILMLIVLPVLVFLGQICIILAVKFDEAGPVSLLRTCDVVFSFIWQYVFLSIPPNVFSLAGGIIVVAGVMLIGMRKWLSALPKEDVRRNRFRCLLF